MEQYAKIINACQANRTIMHKSASKGMSKQQWKKLRKENHKRNEWHGMEWQQIYV